MLASRNEPVPNKSFASRKQTVYAPTVAVYLKIISKPLLSSENQRIELLPPSWPNTKPSSRLIGVPTLLYQCRPFFTKVFTVLLGVRRECKLASPGRLILKENQEG